MHDPCSHRIHIILVSRRDDSDEYAYRRAEEPNRYALQQDLDRFPFDSNAAKNLEEKWKDISITQGNEVCNKATNMSTKDLLFNRMTNIHHHLVQLNKRGVFLSYPLIYCIGTHGDHASKTQ